MKKTLLGICAILLFTGCFAKKANNEVSIKIDGNDRVSLEYSIVDDSNIIVVAKNISDDTIDYITLNLAIYDKKGKLIGVEKQYLRNLVANQENIIKVPLSDVASDKDEKPSKVEMAVKAISYTDKVETAYTDKVEGKVEKTESDGQLNLTIKNNSGVTINDLSASVVFYKNSKIVDLYSVTAQNVGGTYTDTIYVPVHNNDSKDSMTYIDYDDVKVVINNASVFNQ